MKDIYELELHEEIKISLDVFCRRVPGGWIYTEYCYGESESVAVTSVFVPYVPPQLAIKPLSFDDDTNS